MGSCCGCCAKKDKNKGKTTTKGKPKGSPTVKKSPKSPKSPAMTEVNSASIRTKTVSGIPVETSVKTNLPAQIQLDRNKSQGKYDPRLMRLLSPPFTEFTQITDHLFITGFFGLTKENIKNNDIKCIITTAHELPKWRIKGIECIRLPVRQTNG